MRDFFASLRRMLAYIDLERLNIGVIVHQFIKEEIIPRLQAKLDAAKTDNEKDRYVKLIAEYEKYSDPKNPESKIYSRTAANVVRTLSQRFRMNDDEMEDLMQQLALEFFQPLRAGGNDLTETLRRIREEEGPLALNKLWMAVVDRRTKYRIRQTQRHHQEKTFEMPENDEGETLNPIEQVPAPSVVDEDYVGQVMKDLPEYIHSKVRNPKFSAMFDIWFEIAQEKGADKVDMKHDVYPILRDRGYIGNDSSMTEQWIGVKRLILDFFQKELGGQVAPKVKRMLHLSSAEVLTYETYRRSLAAWMLGGVLRGTIEASEQE